MIGSKRILSLVLVGVFILAAVLAGCTPAPTATPTAGPTATPTTAPLEEVELVYYFVNSPQADLDAVQSELSKLVKEKINATVKLNLVDWGAYDQKMSVVIASGEEYDLCFTSTWTNNFYQNVAKGAYLAIDDLLDTYAPATKAAIPEMFLKVAQVNGKTYAVPNFQQATAGYGYGIQKSIADKYKLDWKSIKKLSDLEPFLAVIKASEPDLIPLGISPNSDEFTSATPVFGMEALGDNRTPGYIRIADNTLTVFNQYDSQEFKDYLKMMRSWYLKGYLRNDVATLKDNTADLKAGKYGITFMQIDLDTLAMENAGLTANGRMSNYNPTNFSYDLQFVKPVLTTDKAAATLTAISVHSKNPERAMMLINLLNTDKAIYNTLCWGVEGKHYTKVSENRIKTTAGGGYQIWSMWEFGNMEHSFLSEGDPVGGEAGDKFIKMWSDLNRNATASPALGFVFDATPVTTEIASCAAIIDEIYHSLAVGAVDPDQYQPILIEKLNKAGAEKIIAEKQKQLTAWKAANP